MSVFTPETPDLSVKPEPFDYNPSSWSQRVRICILAAFGFLIAVYLGLYQWRLIGGIWDPFFGEGSEIVLDSDVSHEMRRWFHIPDAIFGAIAYLGDIIFALAGSTRRWQYRPWLVLIFGLDVIPLGIVGAVLVFLQGYAVGAWCTLCIASAIISLILVVLAYDEVWSCLLYLWKLWRKTSSVSEFWNIFWGLPSPIAEEAGEEVIRRKS